MASGDAETELADRIRGMFDELMNHRRPEAIGDYFEEDVFDHSPAPDQAPGRAGVEEMMRRLLDSDPTLRVRVDDVVVQGERVAVRETWHTAGGTWDIAHFFRVRDGRVAEEWSLGWPGSPPPASDGSDTSEGSVP
jgi:predicted SnoaL-like aldol condensation-catalyzing enzyme